MHSLLTKRNQPLGFDFRPAPEYTQLPAQLCSRLLRAQSKLCKLGARLDFANSLIVNGLDQVGEEPLFHRLRHRLSDAFVEKNDAEGRDILAVMKLQLEERQNAWRREQTASEAIARASAGTFVRRDPKKWLELLLHTQSEILGTRGQLRREFVRLGVDAKGNYWGFPPPQVLPQLIGELGCAVQQAYQEAPLYAAVVALSGVNAIHPFVDGNGRASRAIFSAVLSEAKLLQYGAYLPLKHIYFVSKFGFELRLREAILLGDYVPIVTYFCDVVDVLEEFVSLQIVVEREITCSPKVELVLT
jgi:hypothetical protein